MSLKFWVFLLMIIGSFIGGYLPTLFGISSFSFVSILTSGIGAIVGIIIAVKFFS